jgi:phosphoribosylglycinamide formyltransferase 1
MSFKIAVLASTNGTDLGAIIDEMKEGLMPGIELVRVVSNVEGCGALQKARDFGVEAVFVDPKEDGFDEGLVEAIGDVDLVCLIGYMKILAADFVKAFEGRIINVHPALLPKFGGPGFYGANVHRMVLDAGETETGMTIHFVTEEVDGGPIFIQAKVAVEDGDTPDTLKDKVQALEKKWYPEAIRLISQGKTAKVVAHEI